MYPGPTIEANQGDRIIVNVTNRLENATYVLEFLCISPPFDIWDSSIHWHGLVCLTQEVSILPDYSLSSLCKNSSRTKPTSMMVPRVSRNVVSHPTLLSFTSKPFLDTETFPLSFLILTLCTSIKLYPGWIFRNNMVAVSPETDTYNCPDLSADTIFDSARTFLSPFPPLTP